MNRSVNKRPIQLADSSVEIFHIGILHETFYSIQILIKYIFFIAYFSYVFFKFINSFKRYEYITSVNISIQHTYIFGNLYETVIWTCFESNICWSRPYFALCKFKLKVPILLWSFKREKEKERRTKFLRTFLVGEID